MQELTPVDCVWIFCISNNFHSDFAFFVFSWTSLFAKCFHWATQRRFHKPIFTVILKHITKRNDKKKAKICVSIYIFYGEYYDDIRLWYPYTTYTHIHTRTHILVHRSWIFGLPLYFVLFYTLIFVVFNSTFVSLLFLFFLMVGLLCEN